MAVFGRKLFVVSTFVIVLNMLVTSSAAYKPVLIVHGIWDKAISLDFMADRIRNAHPGTNTTVIDILHGRHSLAPMWDQVEAFGAVVRQFSQDNPDGVHLLCYSQGGLICRGIIESMPDINVSTFVSLSSPQGGQYGDSFLRMVFHKAVKKTVHRVFYTSPGQKYSVANYWNDPHHQDAYLKNCKYLPYIDNVVSTANSSDFKANFIKLDRLILIGGPDDGVITPWQSSHFACFDEMENVLHMKKRDIYIDDLFGLKTLRPKTKIYTVMGVTHHQWHHNTDVIDNCILPHLT